MVGDINRNQYPNIKAIYILNDVNDSSGNGLTLTNNGSVLFQGGGADGGAGNTSKYLSIANDLSYANGAYTIMFRVRLHAEISSGTHKFVEVADAGTNTSLVVNYIYNGGNRQLEGFHLRNLIAAEQATYTGALLGTKPHTIAFVNDATNLILYLDGSEVARVAFNSGTGNSGMSDITTILADRAGTNHASAIIGKAVFIAGALTAKQVKEYHAWASGARTSVA